MLCFLFCRAARQASSEVAWRHRLESRAVYEALVIWSVSHLDRTKKNAIASSDAVSVWNVSDILWATGASE